MKIQRQFLQFTLPVENVFWQEAISLFGVKHNRQYDRKENYSKMKNRTGNLTLASVNFYRKHREKHFILWKVTVGTYLGNLMDGFSESFSAKCYGCKIKTYLYIRRCKKCMQQTTTFCINNSKHSRWVCMIFSRTGTVLRKFECGRTEMIFSFLNAIFRNSKTSSNSSASRGG